MRAAVFTACPLKGALGAASHPSGQTVNLCPCVPAGPFRPPTPLLPGVGSCCLELHRAGPGALGRGRAAVASS